MKYKLNVVMYLEAESKAEAMDAALDAMQGREDCANVLAWNADYPEQLSAKDLPALKLAMTEVN